MQTFFQEIGLFLWAVIAHWQSYVTGGIVTAIVTIYERKTHRELPWHYYLSVFVISAGLVAVFYAWHDEHRNAQVLIDQKAAANGLLGTCNGHLEAQTQRADSLDTQNRTQQQTINTQQQTLTAQQQTMNSQQLTANSQQVAMNSCVVALGKANTPEPQQFTARFHEIDVQSKQGKHQIEMIILTNKPISPVHMLLSCESEVSAFNALIPGAGVQAGGNTRVANNHQTEISIASPAWTPTNPLVVTIYYNGDSMGRCSFGML